jgi:hypothetical protein
MGVSLVEQPGLCPGRSERVVGGEPVVSGVGRRGNAAARIVAIVLVEADPKEEDVEQQDWSLGSESFRRRMRCAGARPEPRRRGRPAREPSDG